MYRAPWRGTREGPRRRAAIFATACVVGICSGLFGVGGGVLLVLLLGFDQHTAQGTSLIALVPPTGLLAFLAYYRAHQVNVRVGLLIIPGVILGGVAGGELAKRMSQRRMRILFAVLLFAVGAWQVATAWTR